MLETIIKKIFGDPDQKKIKLYKKYLSDIFKREKEFEHYSIEDVQKKTAEFKAKFVGLNFKNSEESETIKDILEEIKAEAFALVRHTARLLNGKTYSLPSGKTITWNMIHYDVQLVGGLALNDGNIAEMRTGEGKTLVATLPAYLNSLTGNAVHIVTVNDYLAKRDSEEMGLLYHSLGLKVGVITHNMGKEAKQEAYGCDIVYATNNEMGFDYLRDNMVVSKEAKVQGPLFYAIVDEVDSILIDEARTPLIISMPDNEPTTKYIKFAELIKFLQKDTHYKIDEKQRTATLTEEGIEKVEELLKVENIYVSAHYNDLHHIENALKAQAIFKRDKDYLVMHDEVLIIDEHTGRVLPGRRYSDGLHQSLEAKEKVTIRQESKTLASITFQNFFRMYWKLSGMTGTAKTEEEEFYKVYALDTLAIPTNKPVIRTDKSDLLFKNERGKFDYIIKLVTELHAKGQPILVGTVSVDKSEYLSQKLKDTGIPHNVLNAKQHDKEAEVIALAGQKGAVTIATNMAGRGTDIKLGEDVKELGGLFIIGSEKHETRRIDNQLRGRSGRQGDPGTTQFLVSPNDDIMRIFGGDKLFGVFNSPMFASLPEDEPLTESSMLTSRVTTVQKQVEGHNFDMRKHILEYDDVMNKHREIMYGKRNKILASENIDDDIREMVIHQIRNFVETECIRMGDALDKKELIGEINKFAGMQLINDTIENDDIYGIHDPRELGKYISQVGIEQIHSIIDDTVDEQKFYEYERRVVLQSIDELWMKHIDSMSHLREEVAFEGYAQKNPLIVYKERAFEKFNTLINEIEFKTTKAMFSIKKDTLIEQVEISEKAMVENEAEIEAALDGFKKDFEEKKTQETIGVNPLFMPPEKPGKKIRV